MCHINQLQKLPITSRQDEKKGETIIAYLILRTDYFESDQLRQELIDHIRNTVGPIATPEEIYFVNKLPKTRSGKIMRRLLKSISTGEEVTGDITTLEDNSSIEEIRQAYNNIHKANR